MVELSSTALTRIITMATSWSTKPYLKHPFNNEKIVDESCIDSALTPSNICPNHNREITKGRPNKTNA
jgi:hypothetical protein